MAVFWIALLRVLGDVRFMISLADMEKTHVFPWCILDILATNSRKEKLALGLYPTKNYLFWHYMIILSYAVVVPDNRDPGNPIVNDPHDPSNMVPLYGHFVLSNLPPNEGVIFPRFFAPFLPSPRFTLQRWPTPAPRWPCQSPPRRWSLQLQSPPVHPLQRRHPLGLGVKWVGGSWMLEVRL